MILILTLILITLLILCLITMDVILIIKIDDLTEAVHDLLGERNPDVGDPWEAVRSSPRMPVDDRGLSIRDTYAGDKP